jgi:hypothetical protein
MAFQDRKDDTPVTIRMIQSSRESEKSKLFYLSDTEHWLPISQIIVTDAATSTNKYIKLVEMPTWLARKQNLLDFVE